MDRRDRAQGGSSSSGADRGRRGPLSRRRRTEGGPTVSQLCDLYLAQPVIITNRGTAKKASSLEIDRSNIERHIKPLLGQVRLRALTRADIEKFQQDVAAGKSEGGHQDESLVGEQSCQAAEGIAARRRGGSRHPPQLWVARGLRADNPAPRREAPCHSGGSGFFLRGDRPGRRGAVEARSEAAMGRLIAAIRLLLLPAVGRGEITGLRWRWSISSGAAIGYPTARPAPRTIPLGDPAIDLLRRVPTIEGSEFVFPASRGNGHVVGLRPVWGKVRELADLQGLRIHDLRHSFASVAVSGGESLYIVGKILGHRQARTTEVYAHLAPDPVQAAADRAARKISEAMHG